MNKTIFPKKISKQKKGRTVMTAMIDLRKIIEEVLVPGIQDIRLKVTTMEVEIRGINNRIDNLEKRIDNLDKRIDNAEKSINTRIDSLEARFDSQGERFDSLERQIQAMREDFKLAIEIHERIATLEGKLAAR